MLGKRVLPGETQQVTCLYVPDLGQCVPFDHVARSHLGSAATRLHHTSHPVLMSCLSSKDLTGRYLIPGAREQRLSRILNLRHCEA